MMKPRNKKLIAPGINCLLWGLISIYSLLCLLDLLYLPQPYDNFGVVVMQMLLNLMIPRAAIGMFSAILLLFSLKAYDGTAFGKATVIVSIIANAMAYVSPAMYLCVLFNAQKSMLEIAQIAFYISMAIAFASLVMLIIQAIRSNTMMKGKKKKLVLSIVNCLLWTALFAGLVFFAWSYNNNRTIAEEMLQLTVRARDFGADMLGCLLIGMFSSAMLLLSFNVGNGTSLGKAAVIVSAIANVISYAAFAAVLYFGLVDSGIAVLALVCILASIVPAVASAVMIIIQSIKKRKTKLQSDAA